MYRIILLSFFLLGFKAQAQINNAPLKHWENSPLKISNDERTKLENYLKNKTNISSLMIIRKGGVLFSFGDTTSTDHIASCRKSVLSMLIGEYRHSIDTTLIDLNIEDNEALLPSESSTTWRNLIEARSCIYLKGSNPGGIDKNLPQRGSLNAGEKWRYSNWDFNLAGHIYELLSKQSIYEKVETKLAIPLMMEDWDINSQKKYGDTTVSKFKAYHMWFSTRDMARIGLLMLNRGNWNGEQLIDSSWVKQITTIKTPAKETFQLFGMNEKLAFGYMWWIFDKPEESPLYGAFTASGNYGKFITVIPKLDLVIVANAHSWLGKTNKNFGKTLNKILGLNIK